MEKNLITSFYRDKKSLAVGKETGFYKYGKDNIFVGYKSGFHTKTNNNILIGNDINSLRNGTIQIGDLSHKNIRIGYIDISLLHQKISNLEFLNKSLKKQIKNLENRLEKLELGYVDIEENINMDCE